MDILRCWLSSRKVQRVGRNTKTNKVSKEADDGMENGVQSDFDSAAGTNKLIRVLKIWTYSVHRILLSKWTVLYVSRSINHIFYQHDYTHTHSYTHYYIIHIIYFTNNFDLLRFIRHILLLRSHGAQVVVFVQTNRFLSWAECGATEALIFPSQKISAFLAPHSPDVFHRFEIYVIGNTWYLVHTFSCIMSTRDGLCLRLGLSTLLTRASVSFFYYLIV